MIVRPRALLRHYSPTFRPVEIDSHNVVRVGQEIEKENRKKPKSLWERLGGAARPDEFTADFGPVLTSVLLMLGVTISSPKLAARWNLAEREIREKNPSPPETTEEHKEGAQKFEEACLARGAYRHNIGSRQVFSFEEPTLLSHPHYPSGGGDAFGAPLLQEWPEHGELIVVDALLVLQKTNGGEIKSYLSDYPPYLRKGTDDEVPLRMHQEVKERLANNKQLALGWHPYCRILGQVRDFEESERLVAPLLISLRYPEPPSNPDTVAEEVLAEWYTLGRVKWSSLTETPLQQQTLHRITMVEAFEKRLEFLRSSPQRQGQAFDENAAIRDVLENARSRTTTNSGPRSSQLRSIHSGLKEVAAFENDAFSGPLAFLLGFYFFTAVKGHDAYQAWAYQIAAQMREDWPIDEWRKLYKYLRHADVLRLDEENLVRLLRLES
jgi:hypothetical protein